MLDAVLGGLIVFLLFVIVFLLGKIKVQNESLGAAGKAIIEQEQKLRKYAGLIQDMQRPLEFKVTDEQVYAVADRILQGVEKIQAHAIQKLN